MKKAAGEMRSRLRSLVDPGSVSHPFLCREREADPVAAFGNRPGKPALGHVMRIASISVADLVVVRQRHRELDQLSVEVGDA